MRTRLIPLLFGVLLTGCAVIQNGEPDGTPYGSWAGKLPCADCPGIETRLDLFRKPDHYRLTQTYLDAPQGQNTVVQRGNWHLKPAETAMSLGTIVLDHTQPGKRRQLRRQPSGALTFLDQQGERIESQLNYTLQRRREKMGSQ